MSRIAGKDRIVPRTEASAMYWNVLVSTAHRSPESPVLSSKAPGTAPSKTPARRQPQPERARQQRDQRGERPPLRGYRLQNSAVVEVTLLPLLLVHRPTSSRGFDRSILDLAAPCGDGDELHSYWTASTMSLLAAERAGRRPAKTPMKRPESRAARAGSFG